MKKRKKEKKEEKQKKKIIKIIGIIILGVFLLLGSFFGVFTYLKNKDPFKNTKNKTIISLGIFDDGTYYISKASSNIKFAIKGNNPSSYKLSGKNNEKVESTIIKENGKNYIKPTHQYEEGETYVLELKDTTFTDKVLKDTKKIEFKIAEQEKSKYKLKSNVKEINTNKITKEEENKIKIKDSDIKENQIILTKDHNTITNAYKITSIEGNTATIESPEISEIFESLDLYKEGNISFDHIKLNKDLEKEIETEVKKSKIFEFLAYNVYAEQKEFTPKISLIKDGDKLKIEVKFSFKPNGKEKLGLKVLKKHELDIKFVFAISVKYQGKAELGNQISMDIALTKSTSIEVSIKRGDEYLKGIEKIEDKEYSKSVQEIVNRLQKEVPDVSENSIDIGAVEIPTGVPGINVYFDIYLQCQFSLVVNADFKGEISSVEHYGFIIDGKENRAYRNYDSSGFKGSFKLTGKEEIRVGLGIDAGISIINKDLANANIGAEGGVYQEAFSAYQVQYDSINNHANQDFLFKIELGAYLKLDVSANVNALFFKVEYKVDLDEMKYPVLTLGKDEITTGISSSYSTTVLETGSKIKIPDFTKNIINLDTGVTRSEPIDKSKISFEKEDGISIARKEDYLYLGKDEDIKIYAVYKEGKEEDKQNVYKTIITIYKHGTILQSQVPNNDSVIDNSISNDVAGSLSIDTDSDAVRAYKQYIINKNYITDYQNYMKESGMNNTTIYDVGYCIYDINKDGVPELIIHAFIETFHEWVVDMVYTYKGGGVVKKIDSIYNYSGIRYNPATTEIIYTETRPSAVMAAYGFYKLQNDKFIYTMTAGHDRGYYDVYTGNYQYDKYYYSDASIQGLQEITREKEESYFKGLVRFSYQDINNIK